ncbi:hypothetical protein ACIQCR_15530 [Streptomyces sp. NPDC093249]|uniref:hypothetical protein n=1 Tax=unclassified Streptomyces TaxID=2593676 RepID=UPI00344D43EE
MLTLIESLASRAEKNRPCAKVCGPGLPGAVELVLLRRLLGLCLRLSLTLSADCPSRKSG